jgi:hypothetical protein
MATAFNFVPTPSKTYATASNAIKAVHKVFPACDHFGSANLHYVVLQDAGGRFFPLFIGERALQHGAHHHFTVCA